MIGVILKTTGFYLIANLIEIADFKILGPDLGWGELGELGLDFFDRLGGLTLG